MQSINPHFLDGRDINGRMRAILVDWLVQVHSKFRLLQETLYMCIAIMDRFLQVSAAGGVVLAALCSGKRSWGSQEGKDWQPSGDAREFHGEFQLLKWGSRPKV